jgi:hypothetical protein
MNSQQLQPHDALYSRIAKDVLGFLGQGHPDYRKIADMWRLSKGDLSKFANVKASSVRFDENILQSVADGLTELATFPTWTDIILSECWWSQ